MILLPYTGARLQRCCIYVQSTPKVCIHSWQRPETDCTSVPISVGQPSLNHQLPFLYIYIHYIYPHWNHYHFITGQAKALELSCCIKHTLTGERSRQQLAASCDMQTLGPYGEGKYIMQKKLGSKLPYEDDHQSKSPGAAAGFFYCLAPFPRH